MELEVSIGRHSAGLDPHLSSHPEAPAAEAVLAWAAARDAVLRGLVHALSNRVGTVAAVGGMLDGDPPPSSVGTAARVLSGEAERLELLLAHFRLATADPFGAAPEPVHVPEVLAEVASLAGYALPDVALTAVPDPAVRPAVAPRTALAHALLAAVYAAGGDGAVVLRAHDDGAAVTLAVDPAPGDPRAAAATVAAVRWLLGARPDGPPAVDGPGGAFTVRLPALGRAAPAA